MEQPLNITAAGRDVGRNRGVRIAAFAVGGVVVIGAVVGVLVAVLHKSGGGSGGGSLSCTVDFCEKTTVPSGANDCSQATCDKCNTGRSLDKDSKGAYCSLDCSSSLKLCAKTFQVPRSEMTCVSAHCQDCLAGAEFALDDKTLLPTSECALACTAQQLAAGCAPGSCTDGSSCGRCVPGFTKSAKAGLRGAACAKAAAPDSMTFFMYRAQKNVFYPPENVDLASAASVMWYLHNEVVNVGCQCAPEPGPCRKQRHYDISLVLRFKVTVKNTQKVYDVKNGQFGRWHTFNSGKCDDPDCQKNWQNYGYTVGCQPQQSASHNNYPLGAWYSLPGKCPSLPYSDPGKTACGETELGGRCDSPDGNKTCTWNYEYLDNVTINEFCGIQDYEAFCASGKVEYDQAADKGTGCDFWDHKSDAFRNSKRVLRLEQMFAAKTPGENSRTVPDPLCDGF